MAFAEHYDVYDIVPIEGPRDPLDHRFGTGADDSGSEYGYASDGINLNDGYEELQKRRDGESGTEAQ